MTPKDPNEPTQGYLPPTPDQLNQDTPITYVPSPDGGGTPPNPGTGGKTGTTPDNGSGEMTPQPDTDGETGTIPDNGSSTVMTPNPDDTPGTGVTITESPVPTTEIETPQSKSPTRLGYAPTPNPMTQSPASTTKPVTSSVTQAQTTGKLPQTDESPSSLAVLGLSL